MSYETRLYQILYPNNALVASQLSPEDFGKHYQIGSASYYEGKLLFVEIDVNFRDEFFNIDEQISNIDTKDGQPKATRFIASYRVLEHVSMDAIKSLYMVTPNGETLELKQGVHDKVHKPDMIRTFAQICPTSVLAITTLNAIEYGHYITDSFNPRWAPKLFFTQIELPAEQFLRQLEENPFMSAPFPFVHPSKLRDAILEIKDKSKDKKVKGVSLKSDLEKITYSKIRHGFWLAAKEAILFFPMPEEDIIKRDNPPFHKAMY